MKALWIFIILIFFTSPVVAFTVRTTANNSIVKWQADQIDVYLSPSLKILGPPGDVYWTIEDAFHTWIDEAEIDLEINFIYEECTPGYSAFSKNTNCIRAYAEVMGTNEDAGGNASITYSQSDGEIFDGDLAFYKNAGAWKFDNESSGLDFKHVALHEVGHFLGLTHSEISQAIMYPKVHITTNIVGALHDDDIYGALALYDSRKIEEQTSCQFSPKPSPLLHSNNLLSFLLSLF